MSVMPVPFVPAIVLMIDDVSTPVSIPVMNAMMTHGWFGFLFVLMFSLPCLPGSRCSLPMMVPVSSTHGESPLYDRSHFFVPR